MHSRKFWLTLRSGSLIFILIFFVFSQCIIFGTGTNEAEASSDSDGDMVSDADDLCPEGVKFDSSDSNEDTDSDGCRDSDEDNCVGNAVANDDYDDDKLCGQLSDTNTDGDSCPLLSFSDSANDHADPDGDYMGNVCDYDDDGDDVIDMFDICPTGVKFDSNDSNEDADRDGCRDSDEDNCVGNAVANDDDDDDKLCGQLSATNTAGDSCPLLSFSDSANDHADPDGDYMGNACDHDDDGDDLVDMLDICPTGVKFDSNDLSEDTDRDGCRDSDEDNCVGNAVANDDDDDDKLCGQLSATNTGGDSCPLLSFSDNANDHADPDGDYMGNACDLDDDNDNEVDLTDIDDDGDGLIEIGVTDPTTNPGSITNVHNNNDGTHYDDGINSIDTGCGGLNSITTCNGYELVSNVTIDSNWSTTTPGASNLNKFSAIFDGNAHSIILTGDITLSVRYIGLFGYVSGVLRNFTLRSTTGDYYKFIKSTTSGTRRIGTVVGVLRGKSDTEHAVIDRVYVVDVNLLDSQTDNTSANRFGGLAGYLEKWADVKNSYTNANIMFSTSGKATYRVGGLVGDSNIRVSIRNSYATGDITVDSTVILVGINYFGGLLGFFNSASNTFMSDCYATGNITAITNFTDSADEIYLGALIGNSNAAIVSNSYATGNITNSQIGTPVGSRYGGQLMYVESYTAATNNYYNVGSAFPDTTIVALGGAHSGMYGYTDTELKAPTAPDYTFPISMPPSTATDTEIGCIARGGTWESLTCTDGTANTLYTGWSTDNWDFGDATQLPALKFTDDSANLIPDQR